MGKLSKKKKVLIIITGIVLIIIIALTFGLNNDLVVTKYDYSNEKIPVSFEGYKIVQISDFHCKEFGKNEENLIELVSKEQPDIICMTGDIVDEDHDIENAKLLVEGLQKIAPVYYVTGNHDYYEQAPLEEFLGILDNCGGCYLNNQTVTLYSGNDTIQLSGLDYQNYRRRMGKLLGNANSDVFNILLFHDSNAIEWVADYGYDLVLSGHVHGGIIRLPGLGGVLGNDGTFFPEYDYGEYEVKGVTLISSSGLGEAIVPRFNNDREIVSITLHTN